MTQKSNNSNNKNEKVDNNQDYSPDRDIQELSDAFTSYMDNVISEEEIIIQNKLEKESPVKDILPDFTSPYNADAINLENENLDEDELSKQFDEGFFEKKEEEHSSVLSDDEYEELSENREKRVFYAALYLSGKPVEIATFRKMLNPLNLENRLITYAEEFNKLRIGVRIRMVSGGYQIVADSDVTVFLEKYFGEKTESLSRAALETAAIIAYRQPVTKAEVEEMREVNSSGTMKYLLDKNLIKVVGRKQVPGKPLLYATTKYFLEYFGLNDLSELPTFREWQELKQNQ
ncbi:MAG: SMC-Scp complex subunit ScpB [Candidatus Mucispirillum faecigallinarum]|nr:SMC-Scp complex subunit ScpB [Candidatus Mucispirillum faecigallinarum]